MFRNILVIFCILLVMVSCKTKPEVMKNDVKNEKVVEEKIIEKPKEYFSIEISIINGNSEIYINDEKKGISPLKIELEKGVYNLKLVRKDFADQVCRLEVNEDQKFVFRHNKNSFPLKQVGIFECGQEPKQVIYSPDDKYIFLPLLDQDGIQIFDTSKKEMVKYLTPPNNKKLGFVEGIFLKNKHTFMVSQMSTGYLYEYSYPELDYKRSISTNGEWPKFIAYSDSLNVGAVSNWNSNNVTIFNIDNGKIIKQLNTPAAPRGLAFTKDGGYLFIASFDGGKILKVETKNWTVEKTIFKQNAAMRHIILNKDDSKIYVSNMYHNHIYEIDVKTFTIISIYKVFDNPNTIDLTPDDRFLFVSSRGPNNPETYLERSPKNGRITVIDLEKKEILFSFEGGNQPTGLNISNDGKYFCFSNFLDKNFEIYWIGDLRAN